RRDGWPFPDGMGGGVAGGQAPIGGVGGALPAVAVSAPAPVYGQLPGAGVRGPDGPEPPPAVCVAPRPVGAAAAAATAPDEAKLGRDGVPWAVVRVNDSGSQVPYGCRAPTSASRPLAVGRCRGSLARQCSISGRTVGGTRSRSGAPCTTRYRRAAVVPVPNGP